MIASSKGSYTYKRDHASNQLSYSLQAASDDFFVRQLGTHGEASKSKEFDVLVVAGIALCIALVSKLPPRSDLSGKDGCSLAGRLDTP